MHVSGSVKSLIQGVSQQPRQTRFSGQCTLQENFSSNPVDGLKRRPPLEWEADLITAAGTVQFFDFHVGSQKYVAAVSSSAFKIFKDQALFQSIALSGAVGTYLQAGDLSTISIDDTTYIASRNVNTAMSTDVMSYVSGPSIVQVLGGQYGRTFMITVTWGSNSASAWYGTPTGSVVTDITSVATNFIAMRLYDALVACTTNSYNTLFTTTIVDDVLMITNTAGTAFTVTVSDGEGGTLMKAVNNAAESLSDLPRFAPNGYVVGVSGSGSTAADDYYVVFQTDNTTTAVGSGFGTAGSWLETVAPGLPYKLNPATMPLGLQLTGSTFTLGQVNWANRGVGDDSTNPVPSFIGRPVNDLCYFQGRLGILSGPAVILSRSSTSMNSNRVTNFWRETAVESTASDVIDMQSAAEGCGSMLRAVPHNRDLIVFSEGGQFIVLGRTALTPDNCSLILTTTFECDLGAKPKEAGRNIFFGVKNGQYINIREFFTLDSIDANDARTITPHVSKYLTGNLQQFVGTSNYDTLLVLTDTTNMFVYEYIWNDSQKLQSSWNTWVLPWVPVFGWMDQTVAYFIRNNSGTYQLYSLDLDIQDDTDLNYKVHLDNRRTGMMTAGVLTIPVYSETLRFIRGANCNVPGLRVLPKTVTDNHDGTYTVDFDTPNDSGTIIYGTPYLSRYKPTMPVIRDKNDIADGVGTLIVQKFLFNCTKTGRLFYAKTSDFRSTVFGEISGRFTGDPRTTVGAEVSVTKQFVIPFRDNVTAAELEVYSNDHTPLTISNMEWVGEYKQSRQRITQGQ